MWKATTQVGCAVRECPNGMTAGAPSSLRPAFLVVCRYAPRGNNLATFAANVLPLAPASPSPSPSPGQNVTSVPCADCNFIVAFEQHNAYRGYHGVSRYVYTNALAASADAYAAKCTFARDPTNTLYGENIYWNSGAGVTHNLALLDAASAWYEESLVRDDDGRSEKSPTNPFLFLKHTTRTARACFAPPPSLLLVLLPLLLRMPMLLCCIAGGGCWPCR